MIGPRSVGRPADDGIAQAGSLRPSPRLKNDDKSLWRGGFPAPASGNAGARHLVLCKPGRLCYTLPAREPLFACSSVAQR